jgi:hypothetical protein
MPETFATLPLDELLTVLLRQMRRPLESVGVHVTDTDAKEYVQQRITGQGNGAQGLVQALIQTVEASEKVLAQWGLTFQQSLDTPMDDIPGWQSTAEFLELANEKVNAELRITLGAALTLALGDDTHYLPYLRHLADGDHGDETVIARRVLEFANT